MRADAEEQERRSFQEISLLQEQLQEIEPQLADVRSALAQADSTNRLAS
jgi:hypothetical protein